MKKKLLILGICATSWLACNSFSNHEKSSASTDSLSIHAMPVNDTLVPGCYLSTFNRDTISMQIDKRGANITGSISYNLYQKDKNDGTFTAEMQGDTLTGWYLFRSEGIMSVRQVAWKVTSGQLIPASGAMTQKKDTMQFSNPNQFGFDYVRPFKKVKCVA